MLARSQCPWACRLALPLISLFAAVSFIAGCGSIEAPLGNLTAISASSTSIRVNQQLQIQNRMTVTAVPLTFFVNGIQGGNPEVGTITSAGVYTAPAIVPTPNIVTITATPTSNPSYPPGTLTVSVLNPIPVLSGIAPANITEGTTTISVTGTQFVYGAQIFWNGCSGRNHFRLQHRACCRCYCAHSRNLSSHCQQSQSRLRELQQSRSPRRPRQRSPANPAWRKHRCPRQQFPQPSASPSPEP